MRTRILLLLPLLCGLPVAAGGQGPSFDRLTNADRLELSERFRRDLWPLFNRGGKDGCVGCHHGKHNSGLRFTGDPEVDFRAMLRDGFLLKDDPGSVLTSVSRKDGKKRMPPGNRPAWNAAEVGQLRDFVQELDRRQKQ